MKRKFSPATLVSLREMPSEVALTLLEIYFKADPTYLPVKDPQSRRWHVQTPVGEFELLITTLRSLSCADLLRSPATRSIGITRTFSERFASISADVHPRRTQRPVNQTSGGGLRTLCCANE